MKAKLLISLFAIFMLLLSCTPKKQDSMDKKYTSAITFLYYEDFNYGVDFIENTLGLHLVMDKGFARVYEVNQKAYLGLVQKRDSSELAGSTLFSLSTRNVEQEYKRVKQLKVYDLTDIKHFESIPLKSFFFNDAEGHKFEIQEFLNKDDLLSF